MPVFQIVIVGGGLIGLASANALLEQWPDARIVVLEKELCLGSHQTTHNSGVIHSGLYYRPGSLKAKMCVEGARLLLEFCRRQGIAYHVCGKVVVATTPAEVSQLESLYQRGVANGVAGLCVVGPERLREMEPYARGVAAL